MYVANRLKHGFSHYGIIIIYHMGKIKKKVWLIQYFCRKLAKNIDEQC